MSTAAGACSMSARFCDHIRDAGWVSNRLSEIFPLERRSPPDLAGSCELNKDATLFEKLFLNLVFLGTLVKSMFARMKRLFEK